MFIIVYGTNKPIKAHQSKLLNERKKIENAQKIHENFAC